MRAGLVAALGITAGCCVHTVAAAVGVSALLMASSTAFTVLKWLGAAYLLVAGVRLLRSSTPFAINLEATKQGSTRATDLKPLKTVFFSGFWTNVLNPKVALFFLAFVPQFIAPGADSPALQFLLLGLLFNVNALPINFGYAALAAWAVHRAAAPRQRLFLWLDRIAGALFVGFGIKLALTAVPKV